MKFAVAERPLVQLQCLRLMLSLRLDPDRQNLIANFVNSYLILSAKETQALERQCETIHPQEAKAVREVTNEWIRKGERRGERRGRVLGERFGEQRGRDDERRKMVVKMHSKGLALDLIASVTDFAADEVLNIVRASSEKSQSS